MSNLNAKIKTYLEQEEMDYWEGVQLYTSHPDARRNLVRNFNERYRFKAQHQKLITELEKLVGNNYTNRMPVLKSSDAQHPYEMVKKTNIAAPPNYEYKVKFKNLPENLQALVVKKGELYRDQELAKKAMAKLGDLNTDEKIQQRKELYDQLVEISNEIKAIHATLLRYDETGEVEEATPAPEEVPEGIDPELEAEFAYANMDYYQRKVLLNKLRSAVPKQKQRAEETEKKNLREKNLAKAALGERMIAELVTYFENTEEPK